MGTAELACASLRKLLDAPQFDVPFVVTQPDKPKGRHLNLQFSPVKHLAMDRGVPILQPERARDEAFFQKIAALSPDLIVVAAYGQILPPRLLSLPLHGCLNVHASLLPRYRGAAPIQWAIIEGQKETGVTIMKMDPGLDTGPIVAFEATPIFPEDTGATLHDRLARLGAELLTQTIPDYVSGKMLPRPQPAEGATYARKITKHDGLIDWTLPAEVIWNRIRGLSPWPGAFTYLPTQSMSRLLKVGRATLESDGSGIPGVVIESSSRGLVVACGSQCLRIHELQLEGGRRMPVHDFLAGHPISPGIRLRATS